MTIKQQEERSPAGEADGTETRALEDVRLPYEAPKIVKKRSVERVTLFSAMGPTSTGLTMMG